RKRRVHALHLGEYIAVAAPLRGGGGAFVLVFPKIVGQPFLGAELLVVELALHLLDARLVPGELPVGTLGRKVVEIAVAVAAAVRGEPQRAELELLLELLLEPFVESFACGLNGLFLRGGGKRRDEGERKRGA